MRRMLLAAAAMALVAVSAKAEQVERAEVALGVAPEFYAEVCSAPVWKGVSVVWKGVADDRADKVVGIQTKKGKEPVAVTAVPSVDKAFDAALRTLFERCGMTLADKGDASGMKISVEVKDFYAGVEKKLVTGKARAKSLLSFMVDQGVRSNTIEVGMELESKEARKGDIKALTKALNNLFAETLKQVVATPMLRDLK